MKTQIVAGPFDGVRFEIDTRGPVGGTSVVWLHGEFGSFTGQSFIDHLGDSVRVFEVQHPGFGRSTGVEQFDSLPDLAIGYWWVFDRLDLDVVALVGHGFGGALAAEIAAQQPQRVSSLTLISPFGRFRAEDPGVDIFATTTGDVLPALYAEPKGELAVSHYPPAHDGYERGMAQLRRVEVLGATSRFVYPFPETGIARRAYRIADIPTEIVWGARDGVLPPALLDDWQAMLPKATITLLAQTAHMAPYEEASATAAAVERAMAASKVIA
jgi:pimeloyl-ACP methyl ester carboxylesterase